MKPFATLLTQGCRDARYSIATMLAAIVILAALTCLVLIDANAETRGE